MKKGAEITFNFNPEDLKQKLYNGKDTEIPRDQIQMISELSSDTISSIFQREIQKQDEGEVKLIKDILRQILNKEPGIEEFKKVERQYPFSGATWYRLIFDGEYLGNVYFEMHPPKWDEKAMSATAYWTLEFKPIKK